MLATIHNFHLKKIYINIYKTKILYSIIRKKNKEKNSSKLWVKGTLSLRPNFIKFPVLPKIWVKLRDFYP